MKITNITWETDGLEPEEFGLPTEVELPEGIDADDDGTDRPEIHYIRLSKDPMGAHWDYIIKFDDEEIIPIIKIN